MIDKVLSAVRQYDMLRGGERVCVALSGGADSVALLHVLFSLRDKLGIEVCAAHLNHMLRGEESDRDEAFVRGFCQNLGIPVCFKSVDVNLLAQKSGESVELAARNARYAFFEKMPADVIATAHTASDSAETVLLNLTRGTGMKGLCGIPPKRGNIIRPLITCTRVEVEEYCQKNDLSFVTDSSNLSDDYTRNKVRHRVVPALQDINPSFDVVVRRMSDIIASDSNFIDDVACEQYRVHKDGNTVHLPDGVHSAVSSRIIQMHIESIIGKSADAFHVNEIVNSVGSNKKIGLFCGFSAKICGNSITLICDGECEKTEFFVKTSIVSRENFDAMLKINKLLLKNAIDCDKISGELAVRTRSEGDSIKIKGRGVTKTLRKIYNEERIPQNMRNTLPVAADGDGVLWVCGVGIAQRVCVDKKTDQVLIFECEIIK